MWGFTTAACSLFNLWTCYLLVYIFTWVYTSQKEKKKNIGDINQSIYTFFFFILFFLPSLILFPALWKNFTLYNHAILHSINRILPVIIKSLYETVQPYYTQACVTKNDQEALKNHIPHLSCLICVLFCLAVLQNHSTSILVSTWYITGHTRVSLLGKEFPNIMLHSLAEYTWSIGEMYLYS